jgi:organic radical activating enzyme
VSAVATGEKMSLATFEKALDLAYQHDEHIALGGGEPTLHPQFEKYLLLAMAKSAHIGNEHKVFIVTNGSITKRAMLIADLTKAEMIDGLLSQDDYHDPIDDEVVHAFGNNVRNVSSKVIPNGRGKQLYAEGYEPDLPQIRDYCCCPDWFVEPNGDIKQCGCDDAPIIGHVDTGVFPVVGGACHREDEFKEAIEEQEREVA